MSRCLPDIAERPGVFLGLLILLIGGMERTVPAMVAAQDHSGIAVVIDVGVSHAETGSAIPFYGGSPGCGLFGEGTGIGTRGEVGLLSSRFLFSRIGLYGGIGWTGYSIESVGDPGFPLWTFDAAAGTEVALDRRFRRTDRWGRIGPELMLDYAFLEWTAVGFGFSSGFVFGHTAEQREELIDNEDFTFADGERSRSVAFAHTLSSAPFHLDLRASLRQGFRLSRKMDLSIGLDFLYTLLSPFPDEMPRGWSLGAGGGLRLKSFDEHREDRETEPMPDVPPPPVAVRPELPSDSSSVQITLPPQRSRLSGEIDLYALDAEGRRIDRATLLVEEVKRIDLRSGPDVIRRVDRFVVPPLVQVDPAYQADAGLLRWEVMLKYGDSVIVRSASDGTDGTVRQDWQAIGAGAEPESKPLSAELILEDSTGRIRTVRAEMPLVMERTYRSVLYRIDTLNGTQEWLMTLPVDGNGTVSDKLSSLIEELNGTYAQLESVRLVSTSSETEKDSSAVRLLQHALAEHGMELELGSTGVDLLRDLPLSEEESGTFARSRTLLLVVVRED